MGGNESSSRYPPQPGWESSQPPRIPASQYTQNTNTPDRRNRKKFSLITDDYHNLDQVQTALRQAGLESSNLIVGIDFTKSNEWTGKHSFFGQSLHAVGDRPNPYEQTISIIGRTLSVFDEDNLIPCFGFGDSSSHDQHVFSFFPDHRPCNGFDEALLRYRQIVPSLKLSGPTSFAPIIEAGIRTVEQSGGQYHVLVIVADGQVTRSVDTSRGSLSPQEKATMDAIVRASAYPLSIVLVGVGDGPWEMMREFDDRIPSRVFDNFQFVNFSELMARNAAVDRKEAAFALAALMEIPQQYRATMELELLGRRTGRLPSSSPLPPPQAVLQADLHGGGQAARPQGYGAGQAARPQGYGTGQAATPQGYGAGQAAGPQGYGAGQAARPQGYPAGDSYSQGSSQYNPSNPPTAYPPTAYPPTAYPPTAYPPSNPYGQSGGKK